MRYMPSAWRLELLGWLRAHNDEGSVISRFQTHQTGALLAYLALNPQRSHTRDEIGDILWPDADVESMRHRFRQALSALRKQLELPGTPHGSILAADRWSVRLNMDAVSTDVSAFGESLKAAEREDVESRLPLLLRAYELYRGELLPGYYQDCFTDERARLAARYEDLLGQLVQAQRAAGDPKSALEYAKKRVALNPLTEESHIALIQLYEALGDRGAALKQFQFLELTLEDEIGERPSEETVRLIEEIKRSPRTSPKLQAHRGGRPFPPKKIQLAAQEPARPKIPVQFTRFFGRAEEIESIAEMLRDRSNRLVTLVGMGGVGKTRLAMQVAQSSTAHYGEHIYFALLAPIDHPSQILDAVAKAIGLSRIPGLPLGKQLAKHLNQFERALLVLDNFEHLLSGASEVRELIQEVEGVQFLVTSRHRLRLDGERLYQLKPLPPPGEGLPTADLLKTPRTQMLIDRAQTVMPDFQITERNAQTIAAICERLEGLPLAIELAAAWARILSPTQMLEQLTNRFSILVSKRPDINERHRTLRATLDYTFSLMSTDLRQFFLSLSVFRGGWTLDAAMRVCQSPDGINMLDELLDWSLIVSEGATYESSDMRCSMLETIQQYAWDQLNTKEREALGQRRYTYFMELARKADAALIGPDVKRTYHLLESEYANLAACLRWCEENRLVDEGLALATHLHGYWTMGSNSSESRVWLERFLAMEGGTLELRTEAKGALASVELTQGHYEACIRTAEECVADYESMGNEVEIAKMLGHIGFCLRETGRFSEARSSLCKSLNLAEKEGAKIVAASTLGNLGMLSAREGNVVGVVESFEESLGIYRSVEDRFHLSTALNNYGFSLLVMGDFENAEPYISESLDILSDLGLAVTMTARINLSWIRIMKCELDAAKDLLRETLLESSRYGMQRQLYCCIGQFAMIARRERRYEQSAVLFFAMIGLSKALGLDSDDPYLRNAADASVELGQVLSPVAFALANARGRSLPVKDLVEFALAGVRETEAEIA